VKKRERGGFPLKKQTQRNAFFFEIISSVLFDHNKKNKMSADASDDEDDGKSGATVEVDGEQVIVRVRCAECVKKGLTTEADENENLGQFYESQLRDDLLCASHYLEELRTLENNYVMKIGKN
jgi:hypothetical protein